MTHITRIEKVKIAIKEMFSDKTDKKGESYIKHLELVSEIAYSYSSSESLAIIGLLHDAMEDIELGVFTKYIDQLELTEQENKSIGLVTRDPYTTYSSFIDRLIEAGDIDALIIKYIDLHHNMDSRRVAKLEGKWTLGKRYTKALDKISDTILQKIGKDELDKLESAIYARIPSITRAG